MSVRPAAGPGARGFLTRVQRRSAVLASVVLAGLAMLAPGCGSASPPLDVAETVDLSRFQGKWYEIARLPRATQSDCHGTTAFYTQQADGSLGLVNQCNLGSSTGPLYTVAMSASVPNSSVPAKLALTVGGYTGDYWILEVGPNYEYAVVGHPSRLYWWLLSRTPTLDQTTVQAAEDRATVDGFDMSQVLYTPQPPTAERESLATPEGPIPQGLTTGCAMAHGGAGPRPASVAGGLAFALLAAGRRLRRPRAHSRNPRVAKGRAARGLPAATSES